MDVLAFFLAFQPEHGVLSQIPNSKQNNFQPHNRLSIDSDRSSPPLFTLPRLAPLPPSSAAATQSKTQTQQNLLLPSPLTVIRVSRREDEMDRDIASHSRISRGVGTSVSFGIAPPRSPHPGTNTPLSGFYPGSRVIPDSSIELDRI